MAEARAALQEPVAPMPAAVPAVTSLDAVAQSKGPGDALGGEPADKSADKSVDKPADKPAENSLESKSQTTELGKSPAEPVKPTEPSEPLAVSAAPSVPATSAAPAVTNGDVKDVEAGASKNIAEPPPEAENPPVAVASNDAPKANDPKAPESAEAEASAPLAAAAPLPEKPAEPAPTPVSHPAVVNGEAPKADVAMSDAPANAANTTAVASEPKVGDKRPAEEPLAEESPADEEDTPADPPKSNGRFSSIKNAVKKAVGRPKKVKVAPSDEADGKASALAENGTTNGPKRSASKREKKEQAPVGRTARKTRSQGPVEL